MLMILIYFFQVSFHVDRFNIFFHFYPFVCFLALILFLYFYIICCGIKGGKGILKRIEFGAAKNCAFDRLLSTPTLLDLSLSILAPPLRQSTIEEETRPSRYKRGKEPSVVEAKPIARELGENTEFTTFEYSKCNKE